MMIALVALANIDSRADHSAMHPSIMPEHAIKRTHVLRADDSFVFSPQSTLGGLIHRNCGDQKIAISFTILPVIRNRKNPKMA